jgi:hypothetical protein
MIIARTFCSGKVIPVQILNAYTIPHGVKVVTIETLDGSKPFWVQGSKTSCLAAWLTTTAEKLTDVHCTHEHTETEFTGGMHFDHETGPWDDIQEHVYCLDCGKEINSQPAEPSNNFDDIPF